MGRNSRRRHAWCGLAALSALLLPSALIPFSLPLLRQHSSFGRSVRARLKGALFIDDSRVILQTDSISCGAAALKSVLAAHGIERGMEELIEELRLTRNGTSMLDLRLAATKAGLPAKSWALGQSQLKRLPLPAIAFVGGNHFVVIRRLIDSRTLEIDDPALGKLRWPVAGFLHVWRGETLVFDPAWTPM